MSDNFDELKTYSKRNNIVLKSRETGLLYPIQLRNPLLLDFKTLCSYTNMSNNMSGVMTLQYYALNLFYSVSKF